MVPSVMDIYFIMLDLWSIFSLLELVWSYKCMPFSKKSSMLQRIKFSVKTRHGSLIFWVYKSIRTFFVLFLIFSSICNDSKAAQQNKCLPKIHLSPIKWNHKYYYFLSAEEYIMICRSLEWTTQIVKDYMSSNRSPIKLFGVKKLEQELQKQKKKYIP